MADVVSSTTTKNILQTAGGLAISIAVLFGTVWVISKAWSKGQEEKQIKMKVNATSGLSSLGAVLGIYYGVSKGKGFWATAGFTLLFSIGGAALGNAYESFKQ